ncbi:RNA polymerase sigma-70 factor (ECF subfamily) [Actinacidiphila bryophytorum]|uniref:RNA polymerase sigma-70 factor (ECF subfamily) n=3 Tax=Actinacidiphila bryophytorum TaxID=1436133 RepID=A0A9W4H167_9ACTN|nr:RNA polymerase sigma-70 factor (ECF subfamily) [Actinacidiphila bryophytorum]
MNRSGAHKRNPFAPRVRNYGVRMGTPGERLPDEALLAGLVTGDADVAVAFVRRFQGRVYGVAVAVLGDRGLAEDVAQQTFERAWKHGRVYDARRGSVQAWLCTIAHNLAVDVARARRATPVDPTEVGRLLDAVVTTTEGQALARESVAELRAAIADLPREQARAVMMAGIYGLTAKQVAESEGIPLGTAKTRIRRAMGRLRAALAGETTGRP